MFSQEYTLTHTTYQTQRAQKTQKTAPLTIYYTSGIVSYLLDFLPAYYCSMIDILPKVHIIYGNSHNTQNYTHT